MNNLMLKGAALWISAGFLSACGGGSGDGSGSGDLSLSVTDAPVDGVTDVWVEFDGMTLKPKNGAPDDYSFASPIAVNLRELTDGAVQVVFDRRVPAGEYIWIKLDVNGDCDGTLDSYVMTDTGGMLDLRIPSDRLKVGNHFTVVRGGTTDLVIEWNLRMGLNDPVGLTDPSGGNCYQLQPSLRVTDMTLHGAIGGTVDAALISDTSCSSDPNTGDGNVVYVFEDPGVVPDDIDAMAAEPLTTADVRLNDLSGDQEYLVPFLAPGDYTVAFTCQAADDNPEEDNAGLVFSAVRDATVTDGETSTVNLGP